MTSLVHKHTEDDDDASEDWSLIRRIALDQDKPKRQRRLTTSTTTTYRVPEHDGTVQIVVESDIDPLQQPQHQPLPLRRRSARKRKEASFRRTSDYGETDVLHLDSLDDSRKSRRDAPPCRIEPVLVTPPRLPPPSQAPQRSSQRPLIHSLKAALVACFSDSGICAAEEYREFTPKVQWARPLVTRVHRRPFTPCHLVRELYWEAQELDDIIDDRERTAHCERYELDPLGQVVLQRGVSDLSLLQQPLPYF